jgi:hypothetical protein
MKGLEPSTFCMASRAESQDGRRRAATIAVNHAGLQGFSTSEPAWLRKTVSGVWGMSGARYVGRLTPLAPLLVKPLAPIELALPVFEEGFCA